MSDAASSALVLGLLAIVPLLLVTMTCFVKISVVLALTRNAIGAPQVPPNLVVMGLALLLSIVVMAPVAEEAWAAAMGVPSPSPTPPLSPTPPSPTPLPSAPAPASGIPGPAPGQPVAPPLSSLLPPDLRARVPALARAAEPLRAFLAKHAHDEDRATFRDLAQRMRKRAVAEDEVMVLAPAFATSELTEAFAIGFLLLLPFLILDLVVGIVLAALGLNAVSATQVALPLKLLLFVAIDGWRLLAEGLILGYT